MAGNYYSPLGEGGVYTRDKSGNFQSVPPESSAYGILDKKYGGKIGGSSFNYQNSAAAREVRQQIAQAEARKQAEAQAQSQADRLKAEAETKRQAEEQRKQEEALRVRQNQLDYVNSQAYKEKAKAEIMQTQGVNLNQATKILNFQNKSVVSKLKNEIKEIKQLPLYQDQTQSSTLDWGNVGLKDINTEVFYLEQRGKNVVLTDSLGNVVRNATNNEKSDFYSQRNLVNGVYVGAESFNSSIARQQLSFSERIKTAYGSGKQAQKNLSTVPYIPELRGNFRAGFELSQIGLEKIGLKKVFSIYPVNVRKAEDMAIMTAFSPTIVTSTSRISLPTLPKTNFVGTIGQQKNQAVIKYLAETKADGKSIYTLAQQVIKNQGKKSISITEGVNLKKDISLYLKPNVKTLSPFQIENNPAFLIKAQIPKPQPFYSINTAQNVGKGFVVKDLGYGTLRGQLGKGSLTSGRTGDQYGFITNKVGNIYSFIGGKTKTKISGDPLELFGTSKTSKVFNEPTISGKLIKVKLPSTQSTGVNVLNPSNIKKTPFTVTEQKLVSGALADIQKISLSKLKYTPTPTQAYGKLKIPISPTQKPISAFYGTGLYERTSGGQLPPSTLSTINKNVKVSQSTIPLTTPIFSTLSLTSITPIIASKSSSKLQSKSQSKTKLETVSRTIQEPIQIPKTNTLTTQLQRQTQKTILQPITIQRQIRTPIITPTFTPSFSKLTPRYTNIPRKVNYPKRQQGLFTVSVRRFGKFKPIGIFSSPKQAFSVGKQRVASSLAASFKVSGNIGGQLPKGLYQSRREKGVFIEKPKYRLSTRGEKREIKSYRKPRRKSSSFWGNSRRIKSLF